MTPDALRTVAMQRIDAAGRIAAEDAVAAEAPVALLYNGAPFAVMMATPADLDDFALGFALSEGIVADPGEFRLVDAVRNADGIALHAAIPQARFDALESRGRNLEGRSGCGLCGTGSLQAAIRPVPRVAQGAPVDAGGIHRALALLSARQPLNAASGGLHAAAFVHPGGMLVREDIGRHNALDKVIGARLGQGLGGAPGYLVITSRASYEIVHKAATAGLGLVVAISAPTELAIRVATEAGLTLVAFARGGTMNVYAHPGGIAG